ncbi:hemerythrin domain-containing protein [Streptomyces sp. H39-S7]|uniref:hemerythrin domain-containing protein n=1 Tax=Streptomyces sp. H39-S7 TaxID=3004357 RepID=UPI0022B007A8|nr:hemerythrin domain-containing protein [Streptomyces sp. H39-S7]MCZ4119415.1 hemerythrin domain-containing protein [Streptomyces sp. H39-S7]
MCHYCGCREIPLIRDFIAEHESVTDHAGSVVRALDAGELSDARAHLDRMGAELRDHWRGEEDGLFAVMGQDEEYRDYIDALKAEHRELGALLAAGDLTDLRYQTLIRAAVRELTLHISKEEEGLFPAALTALTGEQWNFAMAAWRAVHT